MARVWQQVISVGVVGSVLTVSSLAMGNTAIAQSDSETSPTEETDPTSPDETLPDDTTTTDDDSDDTPRFTCEQQNGQYIVMYSPKSQPGEMYPWATPQDLGSAWPAERRCNEISRRLESYRPDGLLELQTGRENGYDTVCVTTESVAGCRIVFTVPPGQDAVLTRDRVFDNLVLADQGETTEGVNTLVEGDNVLDDLSDVLGFPSSRNPATSGNINLQPFLDAADGGTGTQLNQRRGRQLNPDNF